MDKKEVITMDCIIASTARLSPYAKGCNSRETYKKLKEYFDVDVEIKAEMPCLDKIIEREIEKSLKRIFR